MSSSPARLPADPESVASFAHGLSAAEFKLAFRSHAAGVAVILSLIHI